MEKPSAFQKAQDEYKIYEVIQDHEITTEILFQRLDDLLDCSDEV